MYQIQSDCISLPNGEPLKRGAMVTLDEFRDRLPAEDIQGLVQRLVDLGSLVPVAAAGYALNASPSPTGGPDSASDGKPDGSSAYMTPSGHHALESPLSALRKSDLVEIAQVLNLPTEGTMPELIQAIEGARTAAKEA